MIPLNYHHLYYFHVIAKEGSITKACEVLYLAQPTLSAQLRQLEKALNVRLFDRVKQRLRLTEEGRFVLQYAEGIFEMGQELQDALRDKSQRGRINVQLGVESGMARAFAHALMACALGFKDIGRVQMKEGTLAEQTEALRRHHIDALLTSAPFSGSDDDFENHLIGKVPVVFAAAGPMLKRVKRIPEDLQGAPVILPSAPSQIHEQFISKLSEWNVQPRILAEVQDLEIVRRLVLDGYGVAPMNAYSVRASQPEKRLKTIPSTKPLDFTESVYLVTRRRRWMNPALQHLLKTFRIPLTDERPKS